MPRPPVGWPDRYARDAGSHACKPQPKTIQALVERSCHPKRVSDTSAAAYFSYKRGCVVVLHLNEFQFVHIPIGSVQTAFHCYFCLCPLVFCRRVVRREIVDLFPGHLQYALYLLDQSDLPLTPFSLVRLSSLCTFVSSVFRSRWALRFARVHSAD